MKTQTAAGVCGCVLAACATTPPPPPDAPAAAAVRVEDARFVPLGGLDQWITIRGDDDKNPLLLLVHGGPGDVQSPLLAAYAPYEHDFILVQWDQRGAGRTYKRHGASTPELTLPRLTADGIALAEYLHRRFPGHDIVLLAHSWGTAIATEMVQRRPELFAAYVGTGQIASWAESVQFQFDFLTARAIDTHDEQMRAELEAIGKPDPTNAEQYFRFTRPLRRFLHRSDAEWLSGLRDLYTAAPGMTESDFAAVSDGMELSGRALLPFQMQERLSTTALRFELPYYVIQGSEDLFTPTPPAVAYFDKVRAPRKQMVVLADAGHFALVTHAPAFVAALRRVLAPVAAGGQASAATRSTE